MMKYFNTCCSAEIVLLHYITLHYKTIYSSQSKKLQGPLWRKSHNNVRI